MIGNRIRKYRKLRKFTQKELAFSVGVSTGYIQMLELGKKNNPSMEVMNKLAEALDVSIHDLIDPQTEKDMMMQEILLIQDKFKEQEALTSGHYELNDAMNFWFNEDLLINNGQLNPSKGILGYIFDVYEQIYNHYQLDKKFKLSATDFFYSDKDHVIGLVNSIIDAVIGQSHITKIKIDNRLNTPIAERIKLPISVTENKDLKDYEKRWKVHFYEIGEKENSLKYNTKSIIDHLENIKSLDTNFSTDDIDKIISTIKNIE